MTKEKYVFVLELNDRNRNLGEITKQIREWMSERDGVKLIRSNYLEVQKE